MNTIGRYVFHAFVSFVAVTAGLMHPGFLGATETIDAVLAVIDQNPILQSDLELAALVGINPPSSSDSSTRVDPLSARIRLELQYLDLVSSGSLHRLDIDISQQLQAMIAFAGGEDRLREILPTKGLEWEDVEGLALRLAGVHAWVERHLRPRVTVSIRDVDEAYRRVILEPMGNSDVPPPSLTHVNEQLRQLVLEEKLNTEIERWTLQARERHRVIRFVE